MQVNHTNFSEKPLFFKDTDSLLNNKEAQQELKDLEIFTLFLDDLVSIDTAFDNILEKTRNCGLDPLFFCKLAQNKLNDQKLLKESDLIKINELSQHIQNSFDGEKSFHELAEKIIALSPDIEDFFKQNVDNLILFLSRKHKEMLSLSGDKAADRQEGFRHIKRTFRDFFLALAKTKNVQKYYNGILESSLGRQHSADNYCCFFTFPREGTKNMPIDSMRLFMNELVHFRKNYLCRYSMHKVKMAIEEKIKQIRYNLFNIQSINDETKQMVEDTKNKSIEISNDCLFLLNTTMLHGSRSPILSNFPNSDMKLLPVGHLIYKGIIPLSGELQEGAVLDERSIKYSEIAATTLDDGSRPLDYSHSFPSNADYEKRLLKSFIKEFDVKNNLKTFDLIHETVKWARFSIAILRVRLMDEQFFNEHKEKFIEGLEYLQTNFDWFKTTDQYKKCMPKELDPDGTLGYKHHDEYYYFYFDKCQMNLNSLKKALTQPVVKIEKTEDFKAPFPIIFGSTNIHTKWSPTYNYLERRTQKFCQLGKDIDFISVDNENINELDAYLKRHNLHNKVKIVSNVTLKNSILLSQLASHYFVDFASCKKLAKIQGKSFNISDVDRVQHTLFQKFWNTCEVFFNQMYDPGI